MGKAKKRKRQQERLHREPIVREVAELLKAGTPTWWRFTSEARHGLRAALCMKGMSWAAADERAELIVRLARHRIGMSLYPTWNVASAGSERIHHFCRACGGALEEDSRHAWCGVECRSVIMNNAYHGAGRHDDAVRRRTMALILGAVPKVALARTIRRCLHCDGQFIPKKSDNRFCSQYCSAHFDRGLPERKCETCEKLFRPRLKISRHCSRLCAARKPKITRPCAHCGETFTTARAYQLTCSRAHGREIDRQKQQAARRAQAAQRAAGAQAVASPMAEAA